MSYDIQEYKIIPHQRAQEITMPAGFKMLCVQEHAGEIVLWVRAGNQKITTIHIGVYAAVDPIPDNPGEYLGTVVHCGMARHIFWAKRYRAPTDTSEITS